MILKYLGRYYYAKELTHEVRILFEYFNTLIELLG
jgi:hypothetical protein